MNNAVRKKLIEVALPLEEINKAAAREKSIRHGHPSPTSPYVDGCEINPGWLALVEILARVESEPYHRPIDRISFQKEAYFATLSGIPTGLEFRRGSYGRLRWNRFVRSFH